MLIVVDLSIFSYAFRRLLRWIDKVVNNEIRILKEIVVYLNKSK